MNVEKSRKSPKIPENPEIVEKRDEITDRHPDSVENLLYRLQVDFDALFNHFTTDGTMSTMGMVIPLHKMHLAILTNTKVATRQDHNALLFVLTNDTQFLFAFTLNLTNEQGLDLILFVGTFGF